MTNEEAREHEPTVLIMDENNKIEEVIKKHLG